MDICVHSDICLFLCVFGLGQVCVCGCVLERQRETEGDRGRRWALLASRAALEKKPQLHSQAPGDTLAIC